MLRLARAPLLPLIWVHAGCRVGARARARAAQALVNAGEFVSAVRLGDRLSASLPAADARAGPELAAAALPLVRHAAAARAAAAAGRVARLSSSLTDFVAAAAAAAAAEAAAARKKRRLVPDGPKTPAQLAFEAERAARERELSSAAARSQV